MARMRMARSSAVFINATCGSRHFIITSGKTAA